MLYFASLEQVKLKKVLMRTKNARAISRMRDAGRMVAECFALLEEKIKPGVPLTVLDKLVEDPRLIFQRNPFSVVGYS